MEKCTVLKFNLNNLVRLTAVLTGALIMAVSIQAASAQVVASASTAGFGAAFGYSQTIGNTVYTQAGSIGNGAGYAAATGAGYYVLQYNDHEDYYYYDYVGGPSAVSAVNSGGNAAAFAQSVSTPFGSQAFIQTSSFGGFAAAAAAAN